MPTDAVDVVRAAEQNADRLVLSAHSEGDQLLTEARIRAKAEYNAAIAEAQRQAAEALQDAQAKNQTRLEEAQHETAAEVSDMLATAQSRQPEAVRKIMDMLV